VAGVDAQRATPTDPRLPRRLLAGCRQLEPSHSALVTSGDAKVEPCPIRARLKTDDLRRTRLLVSPDTRTGPEAARTQSSPAKFSPLTQIALALAHVAGIIDTFRLAMADSPHTSLFECFMACRWNNQYQLFKWKFLADLYIRMRVTACRWNNRQIMYREHNQYRSLQNSSTNLSGRCTHLKTRWFSFPEPATA
jgi:hypothetical protein